MTTISNMSGAEQRRSKREFSPDAYSRRQADILISSTDDINLIQKFFSHRNKHVIRHAKHRTDRLENPVKVDEVVQPKLEEPTAPPMTTDDATIGYMVETSASSPVNVKSEFDLLVERFTSEGKKDPIKSARASIARRAQLVRKAAAS